MDEDLIRAILAYQKMIYEVLLIGLGQQQAEHIAQLHANGEWLTRANFELDSN